MAQQTAAIHERRLKIVSMPPMMIVDILNWGTSPIGRYLRVPSDAGLPDDCVVLYCFPSQEKQTIDFVVAHESFGVVPDGDQIPRHPGMYQPTVTLQRDYDGEEAKMLKVQLQDSEIRNQQLQDEAAALKEKTSELMDSLEAVASEMSPFGLE